MPRKRTRDQDGIFARPDSPFWWASFPDRDGRAARRSTGVRQAEDPNQVRAKAIRAQWILETEAERLQDQIPAALEHSFDELMLAYLGAVTVLKKAGERDHTSAKQLYPVFSGRVLESLRAVDARAYVAKRQAAGAAAGTINKEVGLMSAALNWARRELEWEVPNPFQGRRLREPPGRTRWLTRAEAQALLRAAEANKRAPHLVEFIRLGLYTGMRPGEILGLEWRRIDLQAALVYLEADDQKNGKVGSVPLNQEARRAIVARMRFRATYCPASPWVFSDRRGQRIASIKKGFATAVAGAGLTDVHPHDLRRTCGSWLVQQGVPIQVVSRLLRHSDIRITDRVYAHLSPTTVQAAVEVLDQPANRGTVSRCSFTLAEKATTESGEPGVC